MVDDNFSNNSSTSSLKKDPEHLKLRRGPAERDLYFAIL